MSIEQEGSGGSGGEGSGDLPRGCEDALERILDAVLSFDEELSSSQRPAMREALRSALAPVVLAAFDEADAGRAAELATVRADAAAAAREGALAERAEALAGARAEAAAAREEAAAAARAGPEAAAAAAALDV